MLDLKLIREQFPITRQTFKILGKDEHVPVIYFDHGASTHPPRPVLDAYTHFLECTYSNVHRGLHFLSLKSTEMFEEVYAEVIAFIGGEADGNTVMMTGNTTGALDLAAHVMAHVDGVTIVSCMEHHSNDLPHRRRGDVIRIDVLEDGTLDYAALEQALQSNNVKLVAVTGASNVTGWMPDISRIARLAHRHGAKILVDGAQLLAHHSVNVLPNNDPAHIDFFAAAGHKAYAPFGSAFLFGPRDVLDAAPPYCPGGGTAIYVTDTAEYYDEAPNRHQGGTPNVAGVIAMGAALKFIKAIGLDAIRAHEIELTNYVMDSFAKMDGVRVLGNQDPSKRLGVVSFVIDGVRHDLASAILNQEAAIATRNGRFCAHPYVMRLLGLDPATDIIKLMSDHGEGNIPGAVRATFGVYNSMDEAEELVRMVEIIRNKKWKGNYESLGPASGCTGNVFKSVVEV